MQKQIHPITGQVIWTGSVIRADGSTFKIICLRDPKVIKRDMVASAKRLLGIDEVQR